MRELVEGKNTIGRTAAVLKKTHKVTFNLLTLPYVSRKHIGSIFKVKADHLYLYSLTAMRTYAAQNPLRAKTQLNSRLKPENPRNLMMAFQ